MAIENSIRGYPSKDRADNDDGICLQLLVEDVYLCREVQLSPTAQLPEFSFQKLFDETAENRHHRRAWNRG